MSQTSMFPVKLTHEEATSGTKDLQLIGYSQSLVRYAVKRESDGPMLPLAEWIGHHLSALCGIPTPEFEIVECLNGELAFGSRWEETATSLTLGTPEATSLLYLETHSVAISEILGLDGFLPNPDRHPGNFLFVNRAGQPICLSMDFSLSNVRDGIPFGTFPLGTGSATTYLLRNVLRDYLGTFDQAAYQKPLATVRSISASRISNILDGAPDEWFSKISKQEIIDWWGSFSSERASQVTP